MDDPLITLEMIGGRVYLYPIDRTVNGRTQIGHRITSYDWEGRVESVEERYTVEFHCP